MAYLYFITGGERSGKSGYAQKSALELSAHPVYVATARVRDDDFKKRVDRHVDSRGSEWTTIEAEKNIGSLDLNGKVVVIDCITLWLTNIFTDTGNDPDTALKDAVEEFDKLLCKDCTLFIISNEIGMGVHSMTEKGRKFVELQGWMNQYIGSKSNKAVLMVSGMPVFLK